MAACAMAQVSRDCEGTRVHVSGALLALGVRLGPAERVAQRLGGSHPASVTDPEGRFISRSSASGMIRTSGSASPCSTLPTTTGNQSSVSCARRNSARVSEISSGIGPL